MKRTIVLGLAATILLSACAQPTQPPPTQTPEPPPTNTSIPPTDTPEPTEVPPTATPTPVPTQTPTPTLTPLPEGTIFWDDFGVNLEPGWTWIEENPEKWSLVESEDATWLRIVGDKGPTNNLVREAPDGDFAITAHIVARPQQNHHQAVVFIQQDEANQVRLNLGYCDHCGLAEGHGYYMDAATGGEYETFAVPRPADETDVYLRLVYQDGSITGYHATARGDWQEVNTVAVSFDPVRVGLNATNSVPQDWEVEDIEARFDYFGIMLP
jgi:hypothetical protein